MDDEDDGEDDDEDNDEDDDEDDGAFEVDGVFHVAGGQDDLAWTDQVNDDANFILMVLVMDIMVMVMTVKVLAWDPVSETWNEAGRLTNGRK